MSKVFLPLVSAIAVAAASPAFAHAEPVGTAQAPAANTEADARIDYSYWDTALKYFVYRMGRSDRRAAPTVSARTGTRNVYGHESRFRLEGNRVAFTFLEPEQVAALTAYKQDLERIGGEVGLSTLSRNEQLAFWINLHNVAVIEQIARAYPVKLPSRMEIGAERLPLDEAKTITVGGVALSPKDIRTKIVYPNWQDPKVMYGFYRGEIGGPSIQREAFTGDNVAQLLAGSANEFVNSLRGTEQRGRVLHVSEIYAEAAPFYFPQLDRDLASHLGELASDDLKAKIAKTSRIEASIYDPSIADLAYGEEDPELLLIGHVRTDNPFKTTPEIVVPEGRPHPGVPRNISRLAEERNEKIARMVRRGEIVGEVTVIDMEALKGQEVE